MERCEGPFAPNQPAASRLPTWPDGCYTLTHSPIPLSISLYLPPFSLSDCCTNQTLNACGLLFTRHSMRHETHTSDAAYRAAWELTGERKHVSLWSSWHAYITSKSMRVCVCVCALSFEILCLCSSREYQTVRVWFSFIRGVFSPFLVTSWCGQGGGPCVYVRRGVSETSCLDWTCQGEEITVCTYMCALFAALFLHYQTRSSVTIHSDDP